MSDILAGILPAPENASSPDHELEVKLQDALDEIQQAEKKLKKAKKKGKRGKKLKRKIRKLKKKLRKLELRLQDSLRHPPRGRLDALLEKIVPEGIKLITALVHDVSQRRQSKTALALKYGKRLQPPRGEPIILPRSEWRISDDE